MVSGKENVAPPLNSYTVLIIGIIGVSTGSIFARLADAPALVTAAYRMGLAALMLIPLAAWKAGEELRSLSGHDIKLAMLSGFFSRPAFCRLDFFFGLYGDHQQRRAGQHDSALGRSVHPTDLQRSHQGGNNHKYHCQCHWCGYYRFRRFCNRR